jgi:hypothetical protein
MENSTFDQFMRRMQADGSRRRLLGGLIGAGGGAPPAPPPRGSGGGAGTDKVAICHFTDGREGAERLRVGRRALRAHLAHGDVCFVDCCVNEDCDPGGCFSGQCVAGTCSVTQLPPGTPCSFGGGAAAGNCTAEGECLPTGSGGG